MRKKIDPNVLRQVFRLNRVYREAKEQAFEETVNEFESKIRPLYFLFFFALTILSWLSVILTPIGPVELYEAYGFYPAIVFLAVSYFTFFLGSKLIFKPTREEIEDDTSSFALFSACRRRELRSLFSIGFAVIHTFFFVAYLVSKDSKLLDVL